MKIPKRMLFELVMDKRLERYDRDKDKWIKVKFDPKNEEHIMIKEMHYAEVEIDFISESMQLNVDVLFDKN